MAGMDCGIREARPVVGSEDICRFLSVSLSFAGVQGRGEVASVLWRGMEEGFSGFSSVTWISTNAFERA